MDLLIDISCHVVMFATCLGLWYPCLTLSIRICTYMYGVFWGHHLPQIYECVRSTKPPVCHAVFMSGPTGSLITRYHVCSFKFAN